MFMRGLTRAMMFLNVVVWAGVERNVWVALAFAGAWLGLEKAWRL